eukprot:10891775-Alexandrium_andersonii.AAC.1
MVVEEGRCHRRHGSASEGHGRRGETVGDHHGRSEAICEPAQFAAPPGSLARAVGRDHGRPR